MSKDKQREIASKGGKSLSLEVRRQIGRKGGMARARRLREKSSPSSMKESFQQEQNAEQHAETLGSSDQNQ